jgi:MFS family permease
MSLRSRPGAGDTGDTGDAADAGPPAPAPSSRSDDAVDEADTLDDGAAEEFEEVLEEGDRALERGSLRTALRYREFRTMFLGATLSNCGTWMQTVVLAAYAYELTDSPVFVGLMVFAYSCPQLVLSVLGGLLADTYDRRKVIASLAAVQMVLVLGLVVLTAQDDPSRLALFLNVLAVGCGNALMAPSLSSLLPTLVPRHELQSAVSLYAVNLNLSRVVGPALGGLLYAQVGVTVVFLINAASFVFVIAAARSVTPPPARQPTHTSGLRRLLGGFTALRRDPVVGRCVLTIALFGFFCLMFSTQLPVIAEENIGIPAKSTAYGLLYATFAGGALAGALLVGSVLSGQRLDRMMRFFFGGFAVSVAAFGLVRSPWAAFPVLFLVGICYFGGTTSLSTIMQSRLDDRVRGRVMAVWLMAWGGTLPLGGLVAGVIIEATNPTVPCLIAGAVAAALIWMSVGLTDRMARSSPRGAAGVAAAT